MGCSSTKSSEKDQTQKKEFKVDANIFVNLNKGKISNFYKLGKVLGEGSFGKVQMVQSKINGVFRAMKILKRNSIAKADERKMLEEMNILR